MHNYPVTRSEGGGSISGDGEIGTGSSGLGGKGGRLVGFRVGKGEGSRAGLLLVLVRAIGATTGRV